MSHVSRRTERSAKTAGAPDHPSGPETPNTIRTPQRGGNRHPAWGGSGAATCPQVQVRARPQRFPGKTRPPTAFNAVDVSALCHDRAQSDFSQAVLLVAHYQGAQYTPWRHPCHARQSATPVRHDSSATECHNTYVVDPTIYAATYTASTGASPMGQVKTPPSVRESAVR